MSFVFPTNASQVQAFAGALFGVQVGSATLAQVNADILANGGLTATLNGYYSATQGSTANAAKAVATNLGLTGAALTEGTAYITSQLNAAAPSARGAVISNIVNLFGTYGSDATFGASATAWNTKLAAAVGYTGATNVAIGTVVITNSVFPLTTAVESKTLGAGNDTFDSLNSTASTTLNAGDVLVGGDGTDRLAIVSSITGGGTLGAGVQTTSVEQLSVNAVTATTVDAATMAGVTDVYNNASLAAVTVTGLAKIANVHVLNTNQSTTATFAADAIAGAADATTVLLNGAATTANSTVTVDGIETINLVAAGTASGSATTNTTVTSNALNTLNVTGVNAVLSAGLPGATATVTGTVTSDAGAHDVTVTGVAATSKLSVSMNAGNDTVGISTIAATHTINGGDGTDTLVAGTAISITTGANISGFEAVSTGAFAVALPTGNLINAVTFTGTGGSVSTVLSGATVSQAVTGTNTVSNTAWTTGTADALTVNVGAAGNAAGSTGIITQNLTATGIDTATINNLQASGDVAARTVGVTSANLKTLTVNSANCGPNSGCEHQHNASGDHGVCCCSNRR